MPFRLQINSWVYQAQWREGCWRGGLEQRCPCDAEIFQNLSSAEKIKIWERRNSFDKVGLVGYTSQYGLGCFEGLKAYPQVDGSLKLFRAEKNAARMRASMIGLRMPGIDEDLFIKQVKALSLATLKSGETPKLPPRRADVNPQNVQTLYIRPFACSESGIGVNPSVEPFFIIVSTNVESYFKGGASRALVSNRIRAVPRGTGWIKCAGNYVASMLARHEAMEQGFMEALFLDVSQRYLEEGSSCNIFVRFDDGSLVTPELGDTVLSGITRDSVMQLAEREFNQKVSECRVPIADVMKHAEEAFATGTAAGVVPLSSISWQGQERQLKCDEKTLACRLQQRLQAIQFGLETEPYGWMQDIGEQFVA